MTRHHCTHPGDEIHAAFARRLRENEEAALLNERLAIDQEATLIAAERECPCAGARNCGCWNIALERVQTAHERSEARPPSDSEVPASESPPRSVRVDFRTHPSAGVPSGAHLMIPSAAPGNWFSSRDGYGEPLRAEMWYWTVREDLSDLPFSDEPFYRIISGPVSLFLPARD
jgi:hypothetical protein